MRVRFEGAGDDTLTVRDPFDAALSELGSIQANRDWASSAEFTGSQMTLSGSTITIVLGTLSGDDLLRSVGKGAGVDDAVRYGHRIGPRRLELLMCGSAQAGRSRRR